MTGPVRTIAHYGAFGPEIERINAILAGLTSGGLRIGEYISDTPATEAAQMRMMRDGEICFARFGSMFPAAWAPEYDGGGIPFVFPSIEAVEAYWDSACGQRARELIRERGNTVILGMNRRSPRHLTANRPIADPAMLRGFRLRIPEIDAWAKVWGSMGAECVQVPQPYVLDQIKSGALDGQENSLKVIEDYRLYEAQKYVMLTQHIQGHIYWAMNADFYESLASEDRAALKQAIGVLTAETDRALETSTRAVQAALIGKGCTFVPVDAGAFVRSARDGIAALLGDMASEVGAYVSQYID